MKKISTLVIVLSLLLSLFITAQAKEFASLYIDGVSIYRMFEIPVDSAPF